jgi:SRSO17 transposase
VEQSWCGERGKTENCVVTVLLGVSRQYLDTLGKVGNCQVAVEL